MTSLTKINTGLNSLKRYRVTIDGEEVGMVSKWADEKEWKALVSVGGCMLTELDVLIATPLRRDAVEELEIYATERA